MESLFFNMMIDCFICVGIPADVSCFVFCLMTLVATWFYIYDCNVLDRRGDVFRKVSEFEFVSLKNNFVLSFKIFFFWKIFFRV